MRIDPPAMILNAIIESIHTYLLRSSVTNSDSDGSCIMNTYNVSTSYIVLASSGNIYANAQYFMPSSEISIIGDLNYLIISVMGDTVSSLENKV